MANIAETAERMAALQSKSTPHPWWAMGAAMQAVLDAGGEDVLALATEAFERSMGESK